MRLLKKSLKIFSIVLLSLVGLVVILFTVVSVFILPPAKLTPLVEEIINDNLDARFECQSIELTFFSTFPDVGIRITNGHMLTNVASDSLPDKFVYSGKDTLVTFIDCKVSFNLSDYILDDKISIHNIAIDSARIYGYVNMDGKTNWDIFKNDTIDQDTTTSTLPLINLKRLQISRSKLAFYDRRQKLYTSITGLSTDVKGELIDGANNLDIKLACDRFRYYSDEYSLPNPVALQLDTKLRLSDSYNDIQFTDAKFSINKIPFLLNGRVYNNIENNTLELDITHELNVQNMGDLLAFVPQTYIDQYKLSAEGEIKFKGYTKGVFGNGVFPTVSTNLQIKNSKLSAQGMDVKVELDLDAYVDANKQDSSYVDVNTIKLDNEYASLDAKVKLRNLFTNLSVDTQLKSDINFTELSKRFFNSDTLRMQGKFLADVTAKFTLDDVLTNNIGKMKLQGKVDVDKFSVFSQPYDLNALITRASLVMTSERKEDRVAKGQSLMNAKLSVDSLNVQYGEDIDSNLRNLYLSFSTPKSPDTTKVVPITCHLTFDRMKTMLPDSTMLWASKTDIIGAVLPSTDNPKEARIIAKINSDSLVYLMKNIHTGTLLTKSSFDLKLTPFKKKVRADRPLQSARRDSSLVRQQRDSTFMLSGTSSNLLSKFDVTGSLKFENMRIWSAYFPLRTQVLKTNLSFTSDDVTLSNAKVIFGKSDFELTGKISSLRRALLRGGRLSATLTTKSEFIDCNELMDAVMRGSNYSESELLRDQETQITDLQDLQKVSKAAEGEAVEGIFVLPRTLNLEFNTEARKLVYDHLELEDAKVQLAVKNQVLQLTNLYSKSNIGQGNMSFFYIAKNRKEASVGFDVDLKEIQVDKFISLMPAVDSLIPMLKSFDGVLDCKLAVTSRIDSTASVDMNSIEAACSMSGKDMVLLDGETFTEISKTLMFKNKKRNVIDSIAVDLTIKDMKVQVYPFLLEMDRYRMAVGGTHNLDMTFNYHISVLKSPVPFKLGVDVSGTIDKYKYKITKCRYKDMFKSVKSGIIDTTNINIRNSIYTEIHDKMKKNLNDNYRARDVLQRIPEYDPQTETEEDSVPNLESEGVSLIILEAPEQKILQD